jgi:hypothetical protein
LDGWRKVTVRVEKVTVRSEATLGAEASGAIEKERDG